MEFLKDYDFTLKYHPGKANVVANALSKKTLHLAYMMVKEYELLKQMRDLNLSIEVKPRSLRMSEVKMLRTLEKRIKESQELDNFVKDKKNQIEQGRSHSFSISDEGLLKF